MKRKWAERKAKEQSAKLVAKERAKEAAKADYEHRKKARQLTEEEKRRARKNKLRQQSRAKWSRFCSDLSSTMLLRELGASMRKEVRPQRPTLQAILKVAVHDYRFTITDGRLAQLKRILSSV